MTDRSEMDRAVYDLLCELNDPANRQKVAQMSLYFPELASRIKVLLYRWRNGDDR